MLWSSDRECRRPLADTCPYSSALWYQGNGAIRRRLTKHDAPYCVEMHYIVFRVAKPNSVRPPATGGDPLMDSGLVLRGSCGADVDVLVAVQCSGCYIIWKLFVLPGLTKPTPSVLPLQFVISRQFPDESQLSPGSLAYHAGPQIAPGSQVVGRGCRTCCCRRAGKMLMIYSYPIDAAGLSAHCVTCCDSFQC